MATPSLAMIPSAYADSKVYSVLPNNGDGDFSFNRDSSATRIGQNGLIQTVGFFGNELVTNGSFDTDSDWTKQTGWTISGGTANYDFLTNSKYLRQTLLNGGFVTGKTYQVNFEITSGTAYMNIKSNAETLKSTDLYLIGSYSIDVTASANGSDLLIYGLNTQGTAFSIDNISIKEVLGDQPRLNYDISNGVVQSCPSLLLEPASTNVINYSEDFSQWSKLNSTVTSNLITSPDGLQNADLINYSISSSNGYVRQSHSASQYVSFYVKYKDIQWLMVYGSGLGAGKFVDIKNSVVGGNVGSGANIQIINVGNDWKRIIFYSSSANITQTSIYAAASDNSYANISLTGGVYLWGAQAEALSYATSYIPTNGSSQTRAAETCNGAGTSSTFNDSEGTIYFEGSALANDGTFRILSLSNGTTSNEIKIQLSSVANTIGYGVVVGGIPQIDQFYTINNVLSNNKFCAKYKANDFALWINGVEVLTDSSGITFPNGTLNTLNFNRGNGSNNFYSNTKDIRVYNEALTDAQLQTLTT